MMASLDYLQEEMQRAFEVMDDRAKPAHIRNAARARFWHCKKRVGTMQRGGLTHDEPGYLLIGYSEQQFYRDSKRKDVPQQHEAAPSRREQKDTRDAVEIAAKKRL